jgi:hypothetical protein
VGEAEDAAAEVETEKRRVTTRRRVPVGGPLSPTPTPRGAEQPQLQLPVRRQGPRQAGGWLTPQASTRAPALLAQSPSSGGGPRFFRFDSGSRSGAQSASTLPLPSVRRGTSLTPKHASPSQQGSSVLPVAGAGVGTGTAASPVIVRPPPLRPPPVSTDGEIRARLFTLPEDDGDDGDAAGKDSRSPRHHRLPFVPSPQRGRLRSDASACDNEGDDEWGGSPSSAFRRRVCAQGTVRVSAATSPATVDRRSDEEAFCGSRPRCSDSVIRAQVRVATGYRDRRTSAR